MKKVVTIKVSVLVTCLILLSSSILPAQNRCDVNEDGQITPADALCSFQEYLGLGCEYCSFEFPAPVPKTGQTTSSATGSDGDLERGVAWPNPRFTDNGDGTVTDNLTGLIWLKDANCFSVNTWHSAVGLSNGLESGTCGLSDGSNSGDWRLPNYKELFSLVDAENYDPALPTGHPFNNVQSYSYWSSTTNATFGPHAWYVEMCDGQTSSTNKEHSDYVWPVRGGQ